MPPHIAILGGGLTGLSAAFHLARRFPSSRITLLEKRQRLGGWVRSERVRVCDSHGDSTSILLEAGPRTLRPNAPAVLELIHLLGLTPALITTPTTSPAAKTRFLHLPPSPGLVALPSSITGLLTSPLTPLLARAFLTDLTRRPNRQGATDESVDAFLCRRFGAEPARVLGSAVVHGVYAADARTVSVRAAFGALWAAEDRGGGSVVRGALRGLFARKKNVRGEYEVRDVGRRMEGVAVFSFREGIQTLTDALERAVARNPNVEIRRGVAAASLRPTAESFEIHTAPHDVLTSSHVVAALPLPALHGLLRTPLPHLTANAAASVTVLNLVFPAPPTPLHPPGFGYLIPRPAAEYAPGSPGILGAVFDSCTLAGQDTRADGQPARTTKLTVMLGGPHPHAPARADAAAVLRDLAAQLGAPLPPPLVVRARHHAGCIPTLGPGHLARMAELDAVLRGGLWGGRMAVVGAGVGGVSVGDCVEAGRAVGRGWA